MQELIAVTGLISALATVASVALQIADRRRRQEMFNRKWRRPLVDERLSIVLKIVFLAFLTGFAIGAPNAFTEMPQRLAELLMM